MTHIKCKFDKPFCLLAFKVQFEGEFCGRGCSCPAQQGNDICRYLRFQHIEFEDEVSSYDFREHPDPEPGLTLYKSKIPLDLITYLEIDGKELIDFGEVKI